MVVVVGEGKKREEERRGKRRKGGGMKANGKRNPKKQKDVKRSQILLDSVKYLYLYGFLI